MKYVKKRTEIIASGGGSGTDKDKPITTNQKFIHMDEQTKVPIGDAENKM